jgi:hypothetical protein
MWPCERAYQISDVTVLFEFRPGKLLHVSSCCLVRDVRGASDNFPPQRQHTLSLHELPESALRRTCMGAEQYVIEADGALSSCAEPGGRLGCYRCISAKHSLEQPLSAFREDS